MEELKHKLRAFVKAREWEQFHSPKNLAMALSVETSEIVELFQWLTQDQSKNLTVDKLEEVKGEIADVMIFLTMLADKLGVDTVEAAKEKITVNEKKYPVDLSKGKSEKYTEF